MSNTAIETILARRSIRRYRPDPISKEEMMQIVQAGLYAPTARGKQPWHICAVTGSQRLDNLNQAVKSATLVPGFDTYKDFVSSDLYSIVYDNAPVFVIISGDSAASNFVEADCAAVLENMFIAAKSLGIGSCWINQLYTLNAHPTFRTHLAELGVPSKNKLYGAACFGYPAEDPPAHPRVQDNYCLVGFDQ